MTTNTLRAKHSIRNPEKWVNKYVRHMANWRDFQWGWGGTLSDPLYVVCEWTGRLILFTEAEEAYYGDYFNSKVQAEAAGYDECYYYGHEGLKRMAGIEVPRLVY